MTLEQLHVLVDQAAHSDQQCEFERCESLCNSILDVQTIDDADRTELHRVRATALVQLSTIYRNRYGDIESAIAHASQACTIAESINDDELRVRSLLRLAWCHIDQKDFSTAENCLDEALVINRRIDFPLGDAINKHLRGKILLDAHRPEDALEIQLEALSLFQNVGDRYWIAEIYCGLGELCTRGTANLSRALEYTARALEIAEPNGFRRLTAYANRWIGVVYFELRDGEQALRYLRRSLELYEDIRCTYQMPNILGDIANTYTVMGALSVALEYRMRSLAINEEIHHLSGQMNDCANIANVYLEIGDYDNVLAFARRSLELCSQIEHSTIEEATNRANIGIVLSKRDYNGYDVVRAEEYLVHSAALLTEINNKSTLWQLHEILMNFYAEHGRWADAFRHQALYHSVKDTIQSEGAKRKAQNMESERLAAIERAAAEATTSLLHKVLPSSIADRLIKGEKIADYFEKVSILFADIVGFTPIAARMPAKAVLTFLNFVFGEFDRVMEKHGCQKIKTIGDGYMAVSGAPIECHDHAERLARAALELMNDIELPEDIRKTLPTGSVFHLRIGLHTGSAFAGIVGDKGFVYDVYSDAVNLASRMESSGESGKIHCSEEFAYHLQNRDESFVFVERGEVDIKGKGLMRTYFMERS